MKKLIAMLLGLTMVLAMIPAMAEKEVVDIYWQWPSAGEVPSGLQAVEDALNAMMVPDIGVRVHLEPCVWGNAQKQAILMVSAGEQLDIMLSSNSGTLADIVESGLILPLDDLLAEYGQDILEQVGPKLKTESYNGKQYGVCSAFKTNYAGAYMIRKDLVEKYKLDVDTTGEKMHTMEDLEKLFEIVKAGEGDKFYCDIPWNNTNDPANGFLFEFDPMGAGFTGGALMMNRSFEDTTIYNLFETDEYKEYARKRYEWAQKGYISPDAAITTVSPDAQMMTGHYLGSYWYGNATSATDYAVGTGIDFLQLQICKPYKKIVGGGKIGFNITITSASPEKAMQALNYIYAHKEAAWLFQFGVEGQSYEVVEQFEAGPQIRYLAKDTTSLPYYMAYGIYGNRYLWPAVYPNVPGYLNAARAEDDAVPATRCSPATGYCFNSSSVSSEKAAVQTVIDQYCRIINAGAADPETILPEFQAALKAAGIDTIIAENQRQLDAFVAVAN